MSHQRYWVVILWLLVAGPLQGARIVSLLPSNTEILDAVGAGDEVVGVTRFDRPINGRAVIGDFFQPNLEAISGLKPDLIVAGLSASNRSTQRLKELGFKVIEIGNPKSLNELYESIRVLAKSVNRSKEGEKVIAEMQKRLQAVAARSKKLPQRYRVYVEIDTPFWTVGGKDFLTEALGYAALDNIFFDLARPSAQVSSEVIVERNPEVILSFDLKAAQLARRAGWQTISAVKKGYVLDDQDRDRLARPSPRLVEGIETLLTRIEGLPR